MEKTAIIGAGNLGSSIAIGLVKNQLIDKKDLTLTKRKVKETDELVQAGYQITSDNKEAVQHAKVIILCVLPPQLEGIIEEINPYLTEDHLLISTITGISISRIKFYTAVDVSVVRAMPNTATAVGASMTCIAADASDKNHLSITEKLFGSIGETLVIEEELMQSATVLGASGIAFFMRYLRAATQAGIQMGFEAEDAQKIAVQTTKGASLLIQQRATHPEVEIDRVTTPQGCTIEGLNEMEHQGFSSSLIKGVMASYRKITEMKSE